MNNKSIKILEYNKIIEMLKAGAASEMTRQVISEIKPLTDIYEIRHLLQQTTEAVKVIVVKGNPPMSAFYDIAPALMRARKGGALTMQQLLQISYNMRTARTMSAFLEKDLTEIPALTAIREVISVNRDLENEITRCILSEDEMADNASPELRSIRRSIVRQNEAIKAKMNHMLGSAENKTLLQDSIVTMRDGRYVIPVKQEHRSKFPGIVLDQSSTGAPLFIEPQVIVHMNIELQQLFLDEKKEIDRILAELSDRVAENYHGLYNNQKLLVELDYIFAKGKLSLSYRGEEPHISDEGILDLKQARHPLLDQKKAVPINASLGRNYSTLIITGPNTGGKTVTLKTAGLLSMMAAAGLHIPASSESIIPVFEDIFADIGDEQSIEQSLSTFSSHMNNIVNIVDRAGPGCLVLLDELGAGTDPTEGAALAIAVLEKLRANGALIFATTHYTELKKYAISTAGVQNASMEFDVETLSPTYRLTIGIPGKSNAFEISRKLGLSESIIDKARELLEGRDIEFEDVIAALEDDRKRAEEERDQAIALNIAMKKQKQELEQREAEIKQKKSEILAKAREEAREIVREAKDTTREVQKELRELNRIDSIAERNKVFDEGRRKVRNLEGRYREKTVKQVNNKPVKASDLNIGNRVKVLSLDQNGEIMSLPDDKGNMTVQMGILKATVNIKDIMLIDDVKKQKPSPKQRNYSSMYQTKAMNMSTTINVRGQNLDDAVMNVDKYLDDAFMAGLKEVTVIHGRGEGILRTGLQQMMKRHKHVKAFRKGAYNEGGDGVTIVQLK